MVLFKDERWTLLYSYSSKVYYHFTSRRRLLSNYLSMGKVLYFFIRKHLHVLMIIFVGFRPDSAIGLQLQSGVRCLKKKIAAIILIYC